MLEKRYHWCPDRLGILGVVLMIVNGCSSVTCPRKMASAQFVPPTPESPIVRDIGHLGSYAVFGGKEGKKQKRIDWPKGVISMGIGRRAQVAVACVAPPGKKPFVVFYNTEGQETGRVELAREPGKHGASLWVGDRGEALLGIAAVPRAKVAGVINPQLIYVKKDGSATVLELERPNYVFFPDAPGYAVLLEVPQVGYELRRYATPGELAWKVKFPQDQGPPSFLHTPREGADVTVYQSGKVISYFKQGKELRK
ncbi:MAG: hypothetical protein GY794_02540 [bacterium]|nr:hypothetical protein [bacterium]